MTVTLCPSRCSSLAATRPAAPAPMTACGQVNAKHVSGTAYGPQSSQCARGTLPSKPRHRGAYHRKGRCRPVPVSSAGHDCHELCHFPLCNRSQEGSAVYGRPKHARGAAGVCKVSSALPSSSSPRALAAASSIQRLQHMVGSALGKLVWKHRRQGHAARK